MQTVLLIVYALPGLLNGSRQVTVRRGCPLRCCSGGRLRARGRSRIRLCLRLLHHGFLIPDLRLEVRHRLLGRYGLPCPLRRKLLRRPQFLLCRLQGMTSIF